jgi:MFS family permease
MLVALMMLNFADKQVLGLAAAPIRRQFGLDAAGYGAVAASFYLLFSLSCVTGGFLADRRRTTWVLGILAVLWAVSALPVLMILGVPALYASRIALGAAEGPAMPVAVHAVHKWFPDRTRAVPTALVQLGAALGVVLTAPALTFLINRDGWRSAFAALAAGAVVWAAVWTRIGREGPLSDYATALTGSSKAAGDRKVEPRLPYRRILLSRSWLTALAAGLGAYWVLSLNVAWLPTYLENGLGYSSAQAARLVALPGVVAAAAVVVVPWLSGRWTRSGASVRLARGVLGGALVAVGGLCLTLVPFTHGAVAVLLVSVALGLPNAVFPLIYLVHAQISPVAQRGAVLAIGTGVAALAGVLAPVITGRIIDRATSQLAGFDAAFAVSAVLLIIGGACCAVWCSPERDARHLGLLT